MFIIMREFNKQMHRHTSGIIPLMPQPSKERIPIIFMCRGVSKLKILRSRLYPVKTNLQYFRVGSENYHPIVNLLSISRISGVSSGKLRPL